MRYFDSNTSYTLRSIVDTGIKYSFFGSIACLIGAVLIPPLSSILGLVFFASVGFLILNFFAKAVLGSTDGPNVAPRVNVNSDFAGHAPFRPSQAPQVFTHPNPNLFPNQNHLHTRNPAPGVRLSTDIPRPQPFSDLTQTHRRAPSPEAPQWVPPQSPASVRLSHTHPRETNGPTVISRSPARTEIPTRSPVTANLSQTHARETNIPAVISRAPARSEIAPQSPATISLAQTHARETNIPAVISRAPARSEIAPQSPATVSLAQTHARQASLLPVSSPLTSLKADSAQSAAASLFETHTREASLPPVINRAPSLNTDSAKSSKTASLSASHSRDASLPPTIGRTSSRLADAPSTPLTFMGRTSASSPAFESSTSHQRFGGPRHGR